MVLKTFSVQEEIFRAFSEFCKENGINMSKQIEKFMKMFIQKEPEAKKEYLEKLERIREQKTIHIGSLEDFRKKYEMN